MNWTYSGYLKSSGKMPLLKEALKINVKEGATT
jgi:hypothetical protein